MTGRQRSRRRRRPRLYLRAHAGCLGCSLPILAVLAVVMAMAVLLAT